MAVGIVNCEWQIALVTDGAGSRWRNWVAGRSTGVWEEEKREPAFLVWLLCTRNCIH